MDKKILLENKKQDYILKVKILQLMLEKLRKNDQIYRVFKKYEEFVKEIEKDIIKILPYIIFNEINTWLKYPGLQPETLKLLNSLNKLLEATYFHLEKLIRVL